MSAYYTYIIQLAQRLSSSECPKALDYGCGGGEIVRGAVEAGIDCFGVDVFYEGGSLREAAAATGLLGNRIFEIKDGRIPMDDGQFDLIMSNQVFEHVDDFAVPLAEIDRVLKPGGVFINVFPSAEVWREGHIGIPFAHWYKKGTKFPRLYHVLFLRFLGLGYHKADKTRRQWSKDALTWIDAWTFYKPRQQIDRMFGTYFSVERLDDDYVAYRLENHSRLRPLAGLARTGMGRGLMSFAASRLAGHVYVLRKPAGAPSP